MLCLGYALVISGSLNAQNETNVTNDLKEAHQ